MLEIECSVSNLKFIQNSRLQCMHGCTHYKRNPMCPPLCKDDGWFKELLGSYQKVKILYEVVDSSDHFELIEKKKFFNTKLLENELKLKREGNYYALGFISGACSVCENKACSLTECNRALVGRTPVCALGIDIMHICSEILKLSIKDSITFWRTKLSKDFFDNSSHNYLCLGLIFY